MFSMMDWLIGAIVGKRKFSKLASASRAQRLTFNQDRSIRDTGSADSVDRKNRPLSSCIQKKSSLPRLLTEPKPKAPLTPVVVQSSPWSDRSHCSIFAQDGSYTSENPSPSSSLPSPVPPCFPVQPAHFVGYGRYRRLKCVPREVILAHIDAQIPPVANLLVGCDMMDVKIPGFDDVTFGGRLRAMGEHKIDLVRAAVRPVWRKTSDGTLIQRGFPGAEIIIARAAAHNSPGLYMADGPVILRRGDGTYYDAMLPPSTDTSEEWTETGFTNHPPEPLAGVRRKWTELEKLRPKWGPEVEKGKAAARDRQDQRAAAYIRSRGNNIAGCFRVQG